MVTRWSDVVSLFHQNEGGIGKSILVAERFPWVGILHPGPWEILWSAEDVFSYTSLLSYGIHTMDTIPYNVALFC